MPIINSRNRAQISKNEEAESHSSTSSEDENEEIQTGKIKNLTGFFIEQTTNDDKQIKRKKFELIPDNPETLISENEPTERLEGVIRATDPAEWQKPIEVEKGATKNLASMFQNICQVDSSPSKKPFKFDIDENAETIIVENEPVVLEGVVRSVDKTEDVIGKRGRIKNLAGRFINPSKDDEDPSNSNKQKTVEIDTNRTRMIQEKWKQQQTGQDQPPETKPRGKVELDSAAEYGVYENEPEVRSSDIAKAGEDQPDVIFVKHTRNLRKMWCQFEKEELAKERDSKNIESIVKSKKKEVQPEPEPPRVETPPPPVEQPKSGPRRFGSKLGKSDAEKPEPQKAQLLSNEQPSTGFQKPTLRSVPKRRF